MTTFYLIRHGSTDYAEKIPGRKPGVHLSKEGLEQSRVLVDRFRKISIDAIYSSPLERAMTTIQPLAQEKRVPFTMRDELLEIDFGKWTGMSFDELENDLQWKLFHSYRNGCVIPDGELMINVQMRMIQLISELHVLLPEKNVILVSHNDPIKSVVAYFCGISLDQFLRIIIDTGSVSAVTIVNNRAKVLFVNSGSALQLRLA